MSAKNRVRWIQLVLCLPLLLKDNIIFGSIPSQSVVGEYANIFHTNLGCSLTQKVDAA
jgi:hypothetical protein